MTVWVRVSPDAPRTTEGELQRPTRPRRHRGTDQDLRGKQPTAVRRSHPHGPLLSSTVFGGGRRSPSSFTWTDDWNRNPFISSCVNNNTVGVSLTHRLIRSSHSPDPWDPHDCAAVLFCCVDIDVKKKKKSSFLLALMSAMTPERLETPPSAALAAEKVEIRWAGRTQVPSAMEKLETQTTKRI